MSLKVFSFLVFPKVAGGNNWLQNQLESNNHPPPPSPCVRVAINGWVVISRVLFPALSFLHCLDIRNWDQPIRAHIGVDWPIRGGKFTDGGIVDATCEGRILSNTSSQRPLGSQKSGMGMGKISAWWSFHKTRGDASPLCSSFASSILWVSWEWKSDYR